MKRSMHAQAGTALVELALAMPLLIIVLLGAVELGRYAYFSIQVANAARAGAQYGAQNGATSLDSAGIRAAAQADGTNSIAALNVSPNQYCQCWNGASASAVSCTGSCPVGSHIVSYVSVQVSGTINPLFHYPLLPSALTVTNTAIMRVFQQ